MNSLYVKCNNLYDLFDTTDPSQIPKPYEVEFWKTYRHPNNILKLIFIY